MVDLQTADLHEMARELERRANVTCPVCVGTGKLAGTGFACPRCHGFGDIQQGKFLAVADLLHKLARPVVSALLVLGLLLGTASQAGAACGVGGVVTNATPYPAGRGWWVAVHYDNNTWASFYSTRAWTVGARTWTYGPCADATRYSQPWLAVGGW